MAPTRHRRWVLHLDMDAFFASVEQLTRPTLRGRPVLVGGVGGRGVVAGCSYEARVFGARSAMPMHQARRLVGAGAVVLPPRGALYQAMSRQVFETVRDMIPVLEQLSTDEAFGEPAQLVHATTDEVLEFCTALRRSVLDRTGLVASIGAGSGKQIAKIASGLAKPDGIRIIAPTDQERIIGALPVRKLWGIGPVADEKLRRLGIDTIGKFVSTPAPEVASILGASIGPSLHQLARGIDDRPVTERGVAKQISAETTYASDLITMPQLRDAVASIAEMAHRRLVEDGRAARTVVLKLRKSDMTIITRSVTLPYATMDKQTIVALAQKQTIDPEELGSIRLVGVGLTGLSTFSQGSLFPELEYVAETQSPDEADVQVEGLRLPGRPDWRTGMDVRHPEYGHGWVQGAGHHVVTVRFETRSSGPGLSRTFAEADSLLAAADALHSLT